LSCPARKSMDAGSRQSSSERASPAQARAARVMR
jgi:hypothetical protein